MTHTQQTLALETYLGHVDAQANPEGEKEKRRHLQRKYTHTTNMATCRSGQIMKEEGTHTKHLPWRRIHDIDRQSLIATAGQKNCSTTCTLLDTKWMVPSHFCTRIRTWQHIKWIMRNTQHIKSVSVSECKADQNQMHDARRTTNIRVCCRMRAQFKSKLQYKLTTKYHIFSRIAWTIHWMHWRGNSMKRADLLIADEKIRSWGKSQYVRLKACQSSRRNLTKIGENKFGDNHLYETHQVHDRRRADQAYSDTQPPLHPAREGPHQWVRDIGQANLLQPLWCLSFQRFWANALQAPKQKHVLACRQHVPKPATGTPMQTETHAQNRQAVTGTETHRHSQRTG